VFATCYFYMNIFFAAGIFYPDVGGPATHAEKIAERFSREGMACVVLAYGDDASRKAFPFRVIRVSRALPKILQWALYVWHCMRWSLWADAVYAFDLTAAGMPACFFSWVFRKPCILRIGGDPIWEREAEMGRRLMPITAYYEKELHLKDRPRLFSALRTMLAHVAVIVVYSRFFKDFYVRHYSVPEGRIVIVKNPVFRRENASGKFSNDPIIMFAGRLVAYKNLPRVMRAFDALRRTIGKGALLLVGRGPDEEELRRYADTLAAREHILFMAPMPQEKLFEKIRTAAVAIGPALSEFNPNFILEALSFGKPALLSRGNGLSVPLPDQWLFDPEDEREISQKMEVLLQPEEYKKAIETVRTLPLADTWEHVTDVHLRLVQDAVTKRQRGR